MSERLTVGAKVLVYTDPTHGNPYRLRLSTIEKVSAKSFRVVGEDYLFETVWMSYSPAGKWPSWRRRVLLATDPRVPEMIQAARNRRAVDAVDVAYADWKQSRSPEHLAALRLHINNLPLEMKKQD